MKAVLFAIISLALAAPAFAEQKSVEVKGPAAQALYKALKAAGVTGDGDSEVHLRHVICDTNTHYKPAPAQCTVVQGFMERPLFFKAARARAVLAALGDISSAYTAESGKYLDEQDIVVGDCAMGRCSTSTGFISCSVTDDAAKSSCTLSNI